MAIPLWDYAVQRGWADNAQLVNDAESLMRLVRDGRVEIVLASSLNGLGRSVSHLVEVLREFVSQRIVLIIPSRIAISKVSSKVFLDVLGCIEEFKTAVARENIAVRLAAAKARGARLGRPPDR